MRGTDGSAGEREGCWGWGTVGSKLKGLTGWLLLWNVPLTAKTRPPTAVCYRQVHGQGEAGGGCLDEWEAGWLRWWGLASWRSSISINNFGQKSSLKHFKTNCSINFSCSVARLCNRTCTCRNTIKDYYTIQNNTWSLHISQMDHELGQKCSQTFDEPSRVKSQLCSGECEDQHWSTMNRHAKQVAHPPRAQESLFISTPK